MGETDHVPAGAFAAAMADLDQGDLAEFVADIYREMGEEVTVDPPVVTVHSDGGPVRLGVLTGESDSLPDGIDAVVTADPDLAPETPSIGPADLRQRVLYALPPAAADDLCEAYLDRSARSVEYAPEQPPETDSGGSGGDEDGRSRGESPARADDSLVGPQVVLVGLLAAVVLATGAGAVFLGGTTDGGDVFPVDGADGSESGAVATPGDASGNGSIEAPLRANEGDWNGWQAIPSDAADTGQTATPTATPESGGSDDEDQDVRDLGADRYADLEPTCERSFLHVVQIQMNALKYNDNETNDGIRTVRRFASPRNREAVGSLEQYVRIIESDTYAPMLTYDSAEYTPWRFGEDRAQVRVVTREDGNVTARYAFRLRKQDGEEYDGCWMTEGVQSLTESTGSDVE
jgi:hypothetical protein